MRIKNCCSLPLFNNSYNDHTDSDQSVGPQNNPEMAVNLSSSGSDATFVLKALDILSSIPDDSLRVRVIWLSNDPVQRPWI